MNPGTNVNFQAFHFVDSEGAQKLKNSKGSEKSRLHLLNYNGLKGKDRYAVAAEIITFKEGEEKKLGWWDRQFNVLHEHVNEDRTSTWYKINKNSLEKRLGISCEELGLNEGTGVVGNKLEELVKAKQKNLDELIGLAKPSNDFERRLIRELAEAGVTKDYFPVIKFFPITKDKSALIPESELATIKEEFPSSTLAITYLTEDYRVWGTNLDQISGHKYSPCTHLAIDHASYEKILSGKPFPKKKFMDQLNQPLSLPKGKVEIDVNGQRVEHEFDSETRPNEIRQWLNEHGSSKKVKLYVWIDTDKPNEYKLIHGEGRSLQFFLAGIKFGEGIDSRFDIDGNELPLNLPKGKVEFSFADRKVEHEFDSKTLFTEMRKWLNGYEESDEMVNFGFWTVTDQPNEYKIANNQQPVRASQISVQDLIKGIEFTKTSGARVDQQGKRL